MQLNSCERIHARRLRSTTVPGSNLSQWLDSGASGALVIAAMASSNSAPEAATPVELHVADTVDFVRSRLPAGWAPEIGIVCGSGLGGLVSGVAIVASIPYAAIPHFPVSSVQGHGKALVFGTLGGKRIVALTGRFHFYEGLQPATVAYGIRCVAALGAKVLVVTNASGGVNPGYEKQDIMLIEDHISFCCLAGVHPLGAERLSVAVCVVVTELCGLLGTRWLQLLLPYAPPAVCCCSRPQRRDFWAPFPSHDERIHACPARRHEACCRGEGPCSAPA
jgi:hypothetical protein